MEILIELLSKSTLPIIATAIAGLASILTTMLSDDTSKRKKKAKEALMSLVGDAIKNDRKLDLEIIGHIKASVEREHQVEIPTLHFLEDFLVKINNSELEVSKDKIEEINSTITKLINEDIQTTPYENLPEEERRLIRALSDAIEHNDKDSIHFNLDELSSVLVVRHKTYSQANRLNKWSVPLAIMGLIFTIIFGASSFFGGMKPSTIEPIIKQAVAESLEDYAGKAPNHGIKGDGNERGGATR